jgi:hypothetical protein
VCSVLGVKRSRPSAHDSEDSCELKSNPLAENLGHPTEIGIVWPLPPNDQTPTFELIAADRTDTIDEILTVALGWLVHDHCEKLSASWAFSGEVLGHCAGHISQTWQCVKWAHIDRVLHGWYSLAFLRGTNGREARGSNRRSVNNLFSIYQKIRKSRPAIHVLLELLPFREQVQLFRYAQTNIGQHGAGLANMVWAENPANVIEICTRKDAPYFEKLASSLNFEFNKFLVEGVHIASPTTDFLSFVSRY